MATAHSTRAPGARSVHKSPATPSRPASRGKAAATPEKPIAANLEQLRRQLRDVALHLEVLYSTCVTVRLALKAQGAEQDEEIARCLMWHVADPLSDQVERLQAIVKDLERRSPVARPVRP